MKDRSLGILSAVAMFFAGLALLVVGVDYGGFVVVKVLLLLYGVALLSVGVWFVVDSIRDEAKQRKGEQK